MKLNNIHKILFITLSNIGDVILTLPVLTALKDNFLGAKIDVVVGPRPREIFAKDPVIRKIFTYDKHSSLKEKLEFIKKLKRERYDLAVDMRSSLIPVLIGAKKKRGLIFTDNSTLKHKSSAHLNKLKPLGVECRKKTNIFVDNKDREKIRRLLEERGFKKDDVLVGVSPACRSPLKQWRTDGFIEVINSLLRRQDCKVVLIGDAGQVNISRDIEDATEHKGLINLTGKIDLNELFALIEQMHMLLTGDTASMHIACDLGVRVVALFGPTDPEEYGPTSKDDIVIRKKLKCSPCRKAVCNFKHECMKEISSEEVLGAVEKLM